MWLGGAPVIGVHYEDRLELMSGVTGETLARLPLPPRAAFLESLHASADNTRLLGGFGEDGLALWDLGAGVLLAHVTGDAYEAVGFAPEGQYAVSFERRSRTVTLRDPQTLEPRRALGNGAVVPLRVVAEAHFVDQTRYRVTGTLTFGDDPPVPYEGEVLGNETQVYLNPQGQPEGAFAPLMSCVCPEPATLSARFRYRGRAWHLRATPHPEGGEAWFAELSETTHTAVGAWAHAVRLRKVP